MRLTVQVGEASNIAEAIADNALPEFLSQCARQILDDAGFAYTELQWIVSAESESITFHGDHGRLSVISGMLSTAPDCHVGSIQL